MVEELKYLETTLTNQNSIQEEIKSKNEVRECMLLFGAETFVFQFANQKFKDEDIQNYNFACFLCGCETWSLTMREERRLRVFENRVLRIIFGPTRDVVIREWRKLHNEKLNDLYSSPSIVRVMKSRRMRWAGYVSRMGERRGAYRVLVGKHGERHHLGDPGVNGRIILRWTSGSGVWGYGLDRAGSG